MILFKKAIRSMLENKRAYIACIYLISFGILFYVAMGVTVSGLKTSRDAYFKQYRMADVFATVSGISKSEEQKLRNIDGIEDVSFRHVVDARVIMPDNSKIITLRLISLDAAEENPINGVITTGKGFFADNDILVAESFLEAHGLGIGDSIDIIISGKQMTFNICGASKSPEYIYIIKGSKELLPDLATFNTAYLQADAMGNLLESKNAYNDISFILKDGYTFDDVKTQLEDELTKFGLTQLIKRDDQPSTAMLNTEIDSITALSGSLPYAFVAMAIIILYLMLKRVIEQDRTQIGTLKAFGFSNWKIIRHYLFYGFVTGLIGSIVGTIAGYLLSGIISEAMKMFFNMPMITKSGDLLLLLNGLVIGIAGGIIGAFMGAFKITRLIPSEAMRPEAPKESKHDVLSYIPFIKVILNSGGSMALRNILRNKFRSIFIVIGIAFSFGILSFIGSIPSMIDDMLINQFTKVQLYDVKIAYKTPVPYSTGIEDAFAISGVTMAEGLLEVPAELSRNSRKELMAITGITPDSNLFKIYDDEKRENLSLDNTGIIISSTLAKNLQAGKGDTIIVRSPLLKDDAKLIVSDVVQQSLGSGCYMSLDALANLLNMPRVITSAIVKTDDVEHIKDYLKEGKNIEFIEDSNETIDNYAGLLGMVQYIFVMYTLVGVVIAVAIIYNTATISVSERKREFATLRVLGMQVKQVGAILSFEYWVLSIFGIALGIPFTILLKQSMASIIDLQAFAFPTYTTASAYMIATFGCIAAVFISNQVSNRRIKSFDMVEVLKERE